MSLQDASRPSKYCSKNVISTIKPSFYGISMVNNG